MIGDDLHDPLTWLGSQREPSIARLAMLSEAQRRSALATDLDPREERVLERFFEVGGPEGGAAAAVIDAIVLDERVSALLGGAQVSAGRAPPRGRELLVAAAERLVGTLVLAERDADAAGFDIVAEQLRLALARVRRSWARLGGSDREEARAQARAELDSAKAASTLRSRVGRRLRVTAHVGLFAIIVWALTSLALAFHQDALDPREAVGAEDFHDLFDLDRIVVSGDRMAAVVRDWGTLEDGERAARLDEFCRRLEKRGFTVAWLGDEWLHRIAGCGVAGGGHGS